MTDSLDTPRPEAREAVHELDGKAYPGSRTCEHWQTVRAELLRLQSTESRAERAEAELAALKARIQWRPLSTAPTDGTCILVSDADGDVRQAKWDKPGWWCGYDCYGNDAFVERPTHWMPLPPPPKGEE